MKFQHFKILFLATLIAIFGAVTFWICSPNLSSNKNFGEKMFPNLSAQINDVTVIGIETPFENLTFEKKENGDWILLEANGYVVNREKIRKMLIGLSELEIIEPKTALPEFYPDISVEDRDVSGSNSTLVSLMNPSGEELLKLLIGKKTQGVSWNGQGIFVRIPDMLQSWLVRGYLDVYAHKISWFDTLLFHVNESDVKSIKITEDSRFVIYQRVNELASLRPVRFSDYQYLNTASYIQSLSDTVSDLQFVDVVQTPADLLKPSREVLIETFTGMIIHIHIYDMMQKSFISLEFYPEKTAPISIDEQAKMLNERHTGWLYEIEHEKQSAFMPFLKL